MLSSKPFYSIITPVFNRADCIGRCIESVIKNLADNIKMSYNKFLNKINEDLNIYAQNSA